MIELFHGSLGGVLPTYSDSGPGNKTLLFGNEQLGYFGEVTESELISRQELSSLTGFAPILPNAAATGKIWLKFFFKGKIIYIAKMPFASGSSWNDFYNAGLVYGTNDNGKYPSATPTNQYNPITKKEGERTWTLIPRLPIGADTDPAPYNATLGIAMGNTQASEMTMLMSRVWNGSAAGITEKWARFLNTDLTLSNQWYTAIQETMSNNSANVGIVGPSDSLDNRAIIAKTAVVHYRPVLELIDATKKPIIPMPILTITSPEPREIYLLDYKLPANDIDVNYGVTGMMGVSQVSKDLSVTYSIDSSSPVQAVPGESNANTSTWGAFTISGEYVV